MTFSCYLGHGDILVMDGQCQDDLLHCTDPGLEQERINVAFLWIRQHTSCPLRAGLVCCLPTYAKGLSASVMENWEFSTFWVLWGLLGVLCVCVGDAGSAGLFPHPHRDSGYGGVLSAGHAFWAEVGGSTIFVTFGEFLGSHKQVLICFNGGVVILVK